MVLFTKEVTTALRKTHHKNMVPVVKIFNPFGGQTWLLTHMEPRSNEDGRTVCWGYADLGMGCVEYGTVYKEELENVRIGGFVGLERDLFWKPVPGMDYSDVLGRKSLRDGPF